jgi:hypothetical protein
MSPTVEQVSDQEKARYFEVYFAAWDILDRTQSLLQRRKLTLGVTAEELNEIEVDLLWGASEQAKLKRRRTAFIRGSVGITPPTQEQVDRMKNLVATVEALTAEGTAASQALAIAKKGLETVSQIQAEV